MLGLVGVHSLVLDLSLVPVIMIMDILHCVTPVLLKGSHPGH